MSDILAVEIFFTKKSNKTPLLGEVHAAKNIYKIIELFNKKG